MKKTIRVLVAEDSPTVRHHLITLIEETPGMAVIGAARDGREVLQLARDLRPDVISMDISMPHIDGLTATRRIMTETPTPVVVVSSLLDEDIKLSLRALDAGALAVASKPPDRSHASFPQRRQQLINTLRAMAGVSVVSRRNAHQDATREEWPTIHQRHRAQPELIALGASTGGPSALYRLMKHLTPVGLPVLIAQHMPPEFLPGLVRWLADVSAVPVRLALPDRPVQPDEVIIAPGDRHLAVVRQAGQLYTVLQDHPVTARYMPSIDVLLESVAVHCGAAAVGVVLTGMGEDGAQGLLAMREAGAYTFAQDEASSTVFGMPAAAIRQGAAQQVVSLANLPAEILKLV